MVHPVSSAGRCTAAVSPSKAAVNINALVWTGLWAACPCAAWTSACPALTAPSREELSCPGNAVRNGCVMSPRIAPWLALPWLVSSHLLSFCYSFSPTSGPRPKFTKRRGKLSYLGVLPCVYVSCSHSLPTGRHIWPRPNYDESQLPGPDHRMECLFQDLWDGHLHPGYQRQCLLQTGEAESPLHGQAL